jgi:hypothetical protein
MESNAVDNEAGTRRDIGQQLSRIGIKLSAAEREEIISAYGELSRLLACLRRVDRGPQVEMLTGYIPGESR